jgi:glycosyltransferase involved in cell wall biosynthesis
LRFARRLKHLVSERTAPQASAASSLYYPFNPLPDSFLEAVAAELKKGVDVCQMEFAEMMSLGCWLPDTVPRLFIHHQIHFVYARRFIEAQGDPSGHAHYLAAMMEVQELAYLKHFNAIVTFSREDRDAVQSRLPGANIIVSPFPAPADLNDAGEIAAAFSGHFCFVALGAHNPNRDALEWLLAEIWPQITARLPSASLHVIGEWSAADQTAFARPGVVFLGFVKELSAALRGGIMLVPLRVGSGLRVKILAALILGVPVVTTTIGAEGLLVEAGTEMLVANAANEFAQAAVKLAAEPALWSAMARAGREAVKRNYSPAIVRAQRNQIYQALMSKKSAAKSVGETKLVP